MSTICDQINGAECGALHFNLFLGTWHAYDNYYCNKVEFCCNESQEAVFIQEILSKAKDRKDDCLGTLHDVHGKVKNLVGEAGGIDKCTQSQTVQIESFSSVRDLLGAESRQMATEIDKWTAACSRLASRISELFSTDSLFKVLVQ